MKTISNITLAFFAIAIGFYPIVYLFMDETAGLLSTKPAELLESTIWKMAFYQHISMGGLCLLVGWSQFVASIRNKHLGLHRILGKIYLIAVLLSGSAALYLAFFASTGWIAGLGFGGLALSWLYSSGKAYIAIRSGNTDLHQDWMIRSFALSFAAVTLRVWMPVLLGMLALDFSVGYPIVAWLCWVPNLLLAELIVHKRKTSKVMA